MFRRKKTPPPCEEIKCTDEQVAAKKAVMEKAVDQNKQASKRLQTVVAENHFSAKLYITVGGRPPQTAGGKN